MDALKRDLAGTTRDADRRRYPGEVVADEYYIRGLRCRRKVLDADRDSDVGCRQRWRVVHAVADHQHFPVDALLFDDCDFVCWSEPRRDLVQTQ